MKIKDFFCSKITKAVEWVLLFACSIGLIVGGVTTDTISQGVGLLAGGLGSGVLVLKFISDHTKD